VLSKVERDRLVRAFRLEIERRISLEPDPISYLHACRDEFIELAAALMNDGDDRRTARIFASELSEAADGLEALVRRSRC
jgi:hypothetical protein